MKTKKKWETPTITKLDAENEKDAIDFDS